MKKFRNFSNFEEKYIFNISLTFWRLLIFIGGLGVLIGLVLLLWGILPPPKKSIIKEQYPQEVLISAQELQAQVNPPQADTDSGKENVKAKPGKKLKESTPDEKSYNISMDSLRVLIPKKYDSKMSKGYWTYPYGKNYWDYFRDSDYRRWVVTGRGLEDFLGSVYKNIDADSFLDRTRLIDSYISTVKLFPEDKRVEVIKALAAYSTVNVAQSVNNVKLLSEAVKNFSVENTDYLTSLAEFGAKNPNDGYAFIEFVNKIIGNFDTEYRVIIIKDLIDSYYNYFNEANGGVARQIEATNSFLTILPEFTPDTQSKALKEFYILYLESNAEREESIRSIDMQYEYDLLENESQFEMNKLKKSQKRLQGFYLIGIGLVLIALLALFLVFLSIQRIVKRIELILGKK